MSKSYQAILPAFAAFLGSSIAMMALVALAVAKPDATAADVPAFRQMVQVAPRDVSAWLRLGEAYLAAGLPDSAQWCARRLLEMDEEDPAGWTLQAWVHMQSGRAKEARATLEKGLRKSGDHPDLLLAMGEILLEGEGTLDQAVLYFTRARESTPHSRVAYNGLGEAYLKLGSEAMAMQQFEKSLAVDSTQVDLRLRLAGWHRQQRRYAEAGRMYAAVLRARPDDDTAALELGRLYLLAKQWDAAARVLQPLAARHPEDAALGSLWLEALAGAGDPEPLLAAAERTLAGAPPPELKHQALTAAARACARLKRPERAVEQYLALGPSDSLGAEDSRLLGLSFAALKSDSLSLRALERSLSLEPDQPALYAEMGAAYMRRGRWEKAADMFGRRLAADSTATSAGINYALCQQQLGRWEESRQALRRVVREKPDHVKARFHLAAALTALDSLCAARREYQAVVRLAENRPQEHQAELFAAHRFLSLSFLADKAWDSAIDSLTKAVRFRPEDVELRLYRAQALFAANRKAEARQEYEHVLAMDPRNRDARKGLDILQQYE